MPSRLYPVSNNGAEVHAALEAVFEQQFPEGYISDRDAIRRDFIDVVSGSDKSRRVFSLIAAYCDPTVMTKDLNNLGSLAFAEGQRSVMKFIIKSMSDVNQPVKESELQ